MARHHLIISGTGRAGTTFLVQLLGEIGLSTGFAEAADGVYESCNAGKELDLRDPAAPYVVKSPWLCDDLDAILEAGGVVVDHAIVPIRELRAAAESRRVGGPNVPGGLWRTNKPESQEAALADASYNLMLTLARWEIPTTLLLFPRLVLDSDYLWRRLAPVLPGVSAEVFVAAFRSVSRPELVHDFTAM